MAVSFYPPRNFTLTPGLEQTNLGLYARDFYRLNFHNQVISGEKRPLLFHLTFLGPLVIPMFYFAFDHTKRPWLYQMRFAVLGVIIAICVDELRRASSYNMAAAYGVGLLQSWGIIWSATLLVWMRPQFDAERVERRKRGSVVGSGIGPLGEAKQATTGNGHGHGHVKAVSAGTNVIASTAVDEDVAASLADGYEYYWQKYPADAPFLTRLEWSMDLTTNMRGTGWNWSTLVIPKFANPDKALSSELVDLTSIPLCTRFGYERYTTSRQFFAARLRTLARDYILCDLCSIFMMKDPYFIFGPEFNTFNPAVSLPPLLARLESIHPFLLFSWRSIAAFVGVFCGLHIIFGSFQVLCYFCLGPVLGTRAELWHYSSINGNFGMVLEKGLAGFWGSWWHQTFRVAFSAPAFWMQRNGYIDLKTNKGKLAASVVAFALSGFLHSLGSMTCIPPTKPWWPPVFFMLSCVGTILQEMIVNTIFGSSFSSSSSSSSPASPSRTPPAPPVWKKYAKYAFNFLFAFVWMHNTQFFFINDMSRSGLWMFEPVPVSIVQILGFGKPGNSWWKWDREQFPFWFVGRKWWEVGLAM